MGSSGFCELRGEGIGKQDVMAKRKGQISLLNLLALVQGSHMCCGSILLEGETGREQPCAEEGVTFRQ